MNRESDGLSLGAPRPRPSSPRPPSWLAGSDCVPTGSLAPVSAGWALTTRPVANLDLHRGYASPTSNPENERHRRHRKRTDRAIVKRAGGIDRGIT
jgi:hypothetical protein